MALKIGTNINYEGHEFLDVRQNTPKTLNDLKNWSVLVPNGFEVCVNNDWYVYDPAYTSEETGHFQKRIDNDFIGSELEININQNNADILELMNEVFPISFHTFSGGGSFENGQKIIPTISWTIERKKLVATPSGALVNGSSVGVSSDFQSYLGNEIETDSNFEVEAFYQGISCKKTAQFRFYHRKYWGVSGKTSLTNPDILNLSSAWATTWTMGATTFDCTGGKYPYYILPTEFYNEATFKCWIGGLRNTDLVVSNMNVTNAFGLIHSYKIIRLGTLQTGKLSIKFAES